MSCPSPTPSSPVSTLPAPRPSPRPWLFALQGWRRRVLFVSLYEAIAIVWNLVFNALFERWEARQTVRGRGFARRAAHAIGFEGGLLLYFVPLFAWWFDVSLWQSFVMDLGLLVFFLIYTFVFNWCFDRVFGLPGSAA